jgi:hypothetical protein
MGKSKMKHELKDELTAEMHAELWIDEETDRKHRVYSVLSLVNGNLEKAKDEVQSYGVTMEDVNQYYDDWKQLQ